MTTPADMVLEVRGLTVEYAGNPATKAVDMAIDKGRIVGVVGESASKFRSYHRGKHYVW